MEKKEYKTPKMEIVEMTALGNLLQSSEPSDIIPIEIEEEGSSEGGE